ncbi:hypothetical protein K502DRAFT_363119 [Neoconidiobolus thromboides FSU 785]|nr:hypothetical protein K502DRAFT_363119 [Neoconidiobolus thromboides FSU 785]
MYLKTVDSTELKNYLLNSLAPISDADNEALSEYIVTLIRNDKPSSEIKQECLEQLEEFLEDRTMTFINKLFSWIGERSQDQEEYETGKKRGTSPAHETEYKKIKNKFNEPRYTKRYQRPCRYFSETGYCKWGQECHYSHEIDHSSNQMNNHQVYDPINSNVISSQPEDEYDPTNLNGGQQRGGPYIQGRLKFNNGANNGTFQRQNNEKRIVCYNIPKESLSKDSIMEYFSRFGEIVEISLNEINSCAEIEFKIRTDASKAIDSTAPIFDNRFVKLEWKAQEYNSVQPTYHTPAPHKNSEELAAMREERIKTVTSLIKQKTELVEKQLKSQKELITMIEDSNTSEHSKKELIQTLNQLTKSIKEQMNSIEEEETILNNLRENKLDNATSKPYPIYAAAGSNKWVKDKPYQARKFKLDNRPKSFIVTGFTKEQSEEVKQFLNGLNYVENIEFDQEKEGYVVSFPNNFYAIKAYPLSSKYDGVVLSSTWIYNKPQEAEKTEENQGSNGNGDQDAME